MNLESLLAKQLTENSRNGLHQRFHPNGRLFREWTVVRGKKDGLFREWNENGTLVEEAPMKRGKVHGVVKKWNSQGRLLGEYKMDMGKGILREWNENGDLEAESKFLGNDLMRTKTYGDPKKKFHESFLWKDTPISKKVFYKLLRENQG